MGKAPLSEGLSCYGGGFRILVQSGWDGIVWPLYCALALRSLLGLFLFFSFFCLLSLVFAGVLVRLCPYSELQVLRPPRSCASNFQWLHWLWSLDAALACTGFVPRSGWMVEEVVGRQVCWPGIREHFSYTVCCVSVGFFTFSGCFCLVGLKEVHRAEPCEQRDLAFLLGVWNAPFCFVFRTSVLVLRLGWHCCCLSVVKDCWIPDILLQLGTVKRITYFGG